MKNGKGKEMNEVKGKRERKIIRKDEKGEEEELTKIRAERKGNGREKEGQCRKREGRMKKRGVAGKGSIKKGKKDGD